MTWAEVLWLIMGTGLVAYALMGGADLGAGVWSVLASGPRREQQRQRVIEAIAPIWEANHVWLIFIIVVMFSAFSRAFAAISIALHVPIALSLLGIVLRGAAYAFYSYGIQTERTRTRWATVFAWSSSVTPVFLGMIIGALGSGEIRWANGVVSTGFTAGWTTPFALSVGLFALALFAALSAVYLAADSSGELAEDFKKRALVSEVLAGALALVVFWRAAVDAPALFRNLTGSRWTWPIQIGTAAAALATLVLLWRRRFGFARFTAALQVGLVVIGWGLAMDHHFVLPDLSLPLASANPAVFPALVAALGAGALLLGPALYYLYRIFKLTRR
jgi:cytochrome bd ubiquinol oxidase subunit II